MILVKNLIAYFFSEIENSSSLELIKPMSGFDETYSASAIKKENYYHR